jgi:putative ABC transport system permease protein
VIADLRHYGLDSEPRPTVYLPFDQNPFNGMAIVARTATEPMDYAELIRREVLAVDEAQPINDVSVLTDVISRSVFLPRLSMVLLGSFAALALVLAVVGIYGVISYSVSQRTKELGLRMALGAEASDTVRLVVGRSMGLVLAGVVLGLAAAAGITRWLAGVLYGVSPLDPVVFVGVSVLLALAALVASLVPARRATRLDPIIALRVE